MAIPKLSVRTTRSAGTDFTLPPPPPELLEASDEVTQAHVDLYADYLRHATTLLQEFGRLPQSELDKIAAVEASWRNATYSDEEEETPYDDLDENELFMQRFGAREAPETRAERQRQRNTEGKKEKARTRRVMSTQYRMPSLAEQLDNSLSLGNLSPRLKRWRVEQQWTRANRRVSLMNKAVETIVRSTAEAKQRREDAVNNARGKFHVGQNVSVAALRLDALRKASAKLEAVYSRLKDAERVGADLALRNALASNLPFGDIVNELFNDKAGGGTGALKAKDQLKKVTANIAASRALVALQCDSRKKLRTMAAAKAAADAKAAAVEE